MSNPFSGSEQRLMLFSVALACFAFLFLTYTPGYMSPDSLYGFQSARQGNLVLYHPPLFIHLFSLGALLTADQSAVLFLQHAVLISAFAWVAVSLLPSSRLRVAYLVVMTIFPALFPIWGVLWKSVWLSGIGLLAFVAAVTYWKEGSLLHLVLFVVLAAVATMIRFESIAAWGVLALVAAHRLRLGSQATRLPRLTIRSSVTIFLIALAIIVPIYMATSSLNSALTVKTSYPIHVTQYFDTLGISARSGEVLLPEYVHSDNPDPVTLAQVQAAFNPATCNSFLRFIDGRRDEPFYLRRPRGPEDAKAASDAWLSSIVQHPVTYLAHRAELAHHLLGLTGKPHYPYHAGVSKNSLGLTSPDTPLKSLAKDYAHLAAHDVKVFHLPITYVLIWLSLVGLLVILWQRGERAQLIPPAAILGAGAAHLGIMLIAAASSDFRFAIWFIVCTLTGAFLLLPLLRPSPAEVPVSQT